MDDASQTPGFCPTEPRTFCVCHVQEISGELQVVVSERFAFPKARGVVDMRRQAEWRTCLDKAAGLNLLRVPQMWICERNLLFLMPSCSIHGAVI